MLLVIGIAIVAGVDKQLEAALVEASRPGEPDHAFLSPLRHHRDACAAFGADGWFCGLK
ncbi:hypothetical protein Q1M64_07720 (plasmid) [Sinorhizobium meliloti]|nr:hypothetical protein Q1M63_09120 [Sinorhizobium meliloti]WKL40100.1 hypothetical protein Q1M64_07720 [Sinorhizobium meliloti]